MLYASSAWCGFVQLAGRQLPSPQQAIWLLSARPAIIWRAVEEVEQLFYQMSNNRNHLHLIYCPTDSGINELLFKDNSTQ